MEQIFLLLLKPCRAYAGYTVGKRIGKFRNKHFTQGNYSQMYHDAFQIVYNNDIKTATFLNICKCI